MGTIKTTPRLTPEILGDDAAVAERIDQLIRPDPRHCRHVKTILNAQRALRGVLSDREWGVHLDLELLVKARFAYSLLVVVRWAFEQGREHPACPPR